MNLVENFLFDNRYTLISRLGSGGFSEVWLVEDIKVGNQRKALKVYAPGKGLDADGVQLFSKEFGLVFDLNHSHLLRPSHFDVFESSPYLVLPYCERGSAAKLVGGISEDEAWRFLRDVASGLAYLHAQPEPIIHQDIKPDNVLIDRNGNYMITDFGISAKARSTLRKSMNITAGAGTIAYMAPERGGRDRTPIKASDVWSLGATLFELMEGDVPFGEHGGLIQKSGAEIPDITGAYSQNLKDIVYKMLAKEPWDRPTAEQIIEWTKGYDGDDLLADKVLKSHDIGFIYEYITKYPNGKHIDDVYWHYYIELDNDVACPFVLGCRKYLEKFPNGKHKEEAENFIKWYEEQQQKVKYQSDMEHNVDSLFKLCDLMIETNSEPDLPDKIYQLINPLALKGNARAQYFLGWLYENGYGVAKDVEKAIEWHKKAAWQGHQLSKDKVKHYENNNRNNNNVSPTAPPEIQNNPDLLSLYTSAKQGNATAMYNLGERYYLGNGVTKNYSEALHWFSRGAELGNSGAQDRLGCMYQNGYGVTKDDTKAVKWYRKASEQGDQYAQYRLAIMYENGWGIPQDVNKAIEWCQKAAWQGNQQAKNQLERLQYGANSRQTARSPIQQNNTMPEIKPTKPKEVPRQVFLTDTQQTLVRIIRGGLGALLVPTFGFAGIGWLQSFESSSYSSYVVSIVDLLIPAYGLTILFFANLLLFRGTKFGLWVLLMVLPVTLLFGPVVFVIGAIFCGIIYGILWITSYWKILDDKFDWEKNKLPTIIVAAIMLFLTIILILI